MIASGIQATSGSTPAPAPTPAKAPGFNFHALLSALNPLQYVPVVGTIYRAVTGDVIPDAVRYAGSMVVSGLLGGPVGLVSNIALTLGEKATGIDPEKFIAAQFHPPPQQPAAPPASSAPVEAPASLNEAARDPGKLAFSPQLLAAYGVHQDRAGTLQLGDVRGADVLNVIELARLGRAAAAYAANQPATATTGAKAGA